MSHSDQSRGYGAPMSTPQGYGQGYPAPAGIAHPGGENYPHEAIKSGEKKKGSNKGALLAAGAGGLVVGGLAGAALADDSSDDGMYLSGLHVALFQCWVFADYFQNTALRPKVATALPQVMVLPQQRMAPRLHRILKLSNITQMFPPHSVHPSRKHGRTMKKLRGRRPIRMHRAVI